MTTQELEKRIEGQVETQNLDFKADCPWDAPGMAKDILAMTNTRDGGIIIIGVKEVGNTFISTGVSDSNISSYKIDTMRDQLSRFADPAVDIQIAYPSDTSGKKYVVIKVAPFRDVPVISKIGIDKVIQANMIYYRNTNKRIESAPVSNSNDLRDILETAAIKIMQKRQAFGYRIEPDVKTVLDNELDRISDHPVLTKIKSNGYWRVAFQPLQKAKVDQLQLWLKAIAKAQINRFWVFPYIPNNEDIKQGSINGGNYGGAFLDMGCRKEFWSAFKTGQFLSFIALPEDWYAEDQFYKNFAEKIKPGKFVALFNSIIEFITMVFEFCARLGNEPCYKSGIRITMTLHNTRNRQLYTDSSRRLPFFHTKTTHADELKVTGEFAIEEITQNAMSFSNKFILQILEGFGYFPYAESILSDQKNYMTGNRF